MVDEHLRPSSEHIHIVEDDDKVASLLRGHLERFGYTVTRAEKWKEVATEVKELEPGLILHDINLPYYDGFYWCREVRRFSRVPIIFVSARDDGMDQVLAIESGGDDYITKPFMPEVVLAKVHALLRRTYGDYAESNGPLAKGASARKSELSIGRLHLDLRRHGDSAARRLVRLCNPNRVGPARSLNGWECRPCQARGAAG